VTAVPFTVRVPGEDGWQLVLAASYPHLLVGPAIDGGPPRWVRADECEFGRVLLDRHWSEAFLRPASEHGH
jgi:hypothetical protein